MPERTGTFPFGNEDRSQSPTISVFHVNMFTLAGPELSVRCVSVGLKGHVPFPSENKDRSQPPDGIRVNHRIG